MKMEVVINQNETIKDIELSIACLKSTIKEDKNNNDIKSLKYHTMALVEYEKRLAELKCNDGGKLDGTLSRQKDQEMVL